MKRIDLKRHCLALSAAAALVLAATCGRAQTITTSYTNSFDSASSVTSWHHWYDINAPTYNGPLMDWDSTMDHTPSVAGSGSLIYSNTWPGHAAGVNNQGQDLFYGTFGNTGIFDTGQSLDATKYDSISFDIHVSSISPTNGDGNICQLQVGTFHSYTFFVVTNINIPTSATNGWTHYVCPINQGTMLTNLCQGIGFDINCYGGANTNLIQGTGTSYFWLDNVVIHRASVKSPPPLLTTITDPKPGLNLFSSTASTDQYQRTNVKLTDGTGAGWIGQTNVTYSMTITNFPDPVAYSGYQAHLIITAGPGTASGPDYADANVIFMDIHENANGSAYAAFRYKTNQPNGNSFLYGAGSLGAAGSASVLGKWSLTFNQDTNILVTSPDGSTFATNITADAAALFNVDPVFVFFGAQPNQPGNIGQEVILSHVSITNGGTSTSIVDDNFLADSGLNPVWAPVSGAPNTVFVFPFDPGQKLVSWTQPDAGFGLQTTTNLSNPNSWTTLTGIEATGSPLLTLSSSGKRSVLVPSADLGPNQNFFRLFTRRFTQLQVLLPGETAAPGTPTGKTGTPDPANLLVPFTITVNAVDANWNLANSADDIIHITTTDTAPNGAVLPADAPLSSGTATFSVTFQDSGTFTVTASDVSDSTKTGGTSSSVTAQ